MNSTKKLSDETVSLIRQYIENNPEEIYIDYNSELSKEQVQKILDGKKDDVWADIEDFAYSCSECDDYYWDAMQSKLSLTAEELEAWKKSDDFQEPSQTLTEDGWNRLLDYTPTHITGTVWGAEWNFDNWAFSGPLDYSDVKNTLRILGINPKEFFDKIRDERTITGWFPDIKDRVPAVDIDKLCAINSLYDGVMNFMFGDLKEVSAVLSSSSEHVVIGKGTHVVMYNSAVGAGIVDLPLTRDVTLRRKDIDIRDDRSSLYGVEECYGFGHQEWKKGSIRAK